MAREGESVVVRVSATGPWREQHCICRSGNGAMQRKSYCSAQIFLTRIMGCLYFQQCCSAAWNVERAPFKAVPSAWPLTLSF